MAFRMFTEPGGYVLVEEYTYLTAIECGLPLGIKFAAIKIDDEGIIPKDFEEVLDTWDEAERAGKKPYLLYTVPTGQNPTGATPSIERRREIYRVAQKHNIYILEDDPYFFIQMLPNLRPNGSNPTPRVSQEQFVASLIPSYLSIDTDGRVFRMDSFSKIIAPGSRTSWITASEQIINRIVRVHETSLQNPAGFSQIMLYKLLHESWGHTGMMNWLFYLQMEYTVRRDNLVNAVETYLPNQLVSLTPPRAGFFVSYFLSCS